MFSISLAAICLAAASPEPPAKPTLNDLAWLAGAWSGTVDGVETEEHWMTPKGGVMLGTNRTTGGKRTAFEFLRIAETDGGVSYFAMPGGRPATEFKLTNSEKHKVVFENPENDFPQRIIYKLADGKLHARIEGTINGRERSRDWVWEPAK